MANVLSTSPSRGVGGDFSQASDHAVKDEDSHEPPLKRRKYVTDEKEESDDKAQTLMDGDDKDEDDLRPVSPLTPSGARSTMQTRPRRDPDRYAPPITTPRPRYSNSASAAAASQASDGYKPREERSWEDFHPDLDINASLSLYTADEVDGRNKDNPVSAAIAQLAAQREAEKLAVNGVDQKEVEENGAEVQISTPMKRKPGRPSRRPESMLSGLGSPPAPRIVPLPTHNPKERLNLPKPSFRQFSHFLKFEQDQKENSVNYVDRSLANIGFQESDEFELPMKSLIRLTETQQNEDEADVGLHIASDVTNENSNTALAVSRVEYDMDEQDEEWLQVINEHRKNEGVDGIRPAIFEVTMTQIEKEYHALEKKIPKPQPRHAQIHRPRSSSLAVNGDPITQGDEPDSKCAICDDGDCENANAIIFCDGCDLAVHQECYGVPFIPEGQWFCRKCKEIGRGTATCIFCPNVDGAFKQTTTLRWSHLLCAIWIPEITIANPTFMEPITDVDKVPKGRWKLNCYICHQKMGACIQCSNKSCYLAFHVTCARRAKLFLKMKSPHQSGIDTTALKAFCDKHVPPDWRRTHDTDHAIVDAKRWYRHAMKDHKWADNQAIAQELGAPPPPDGGIVEANVAEDALTSPNQKRKRNEKPKVYWRLPSGAPIVPAVVFDTVDASLTRFNIRRRKEFVEKACRYWTLKREARRGASLLKRLQLQLESFSSMEITRRNFVGLAGREKLERRIDFAEMLQEDMKHVVGLAELVKEREELRLQEIELLRTLVDTVYFPIPPLLWPILERAQKLDEKTHFFSAGLHTVEERLRERHYTSVTPFSHDLGLIFANKPIAEPANEDDNERPRSSSQRTPSKTNSFDENQPVDTKAETARNIAISHEQKGLKSTAKRIIKAIKEPLEQATRKEAELRGIDRGEALRKLDNMAIFSTAAGKIDDVAILDEAMNPEHKDADGDIVMIDTGDARTKNGKTKSAKKGSKARRQDHAEPLSPPTSTDSAAGQQVDGQVNGDGDADVENDVVSAGGIPWYLKGFNPEGTTIHEEEYSGQKVLRDMSEELSDMDEDTLTELAVNGNAPKEVKRPAKRGRKPKDPDKKADAKKVIQRQQPRRSQRI